MLPMSVLPIRPIPKLNDSSIGANRRARIIVGGCVLILLAFTTATVFVDQMWAIGTFEIGVFVVSAACLLSGIYKGEELISGGVAQWLVYLIPWWGVLQSSLTPRLRRQIQGRPFFGGARCPGSS